MFNSWVDITMTATCRPEVIVRTLESFLDNVEYNGRYRLIINIDPIGTSCQAETLDFVTTVFDPKQHQVMPFLPSQANFPNAFIRVWKAVEAPFVFHLEDDWEIVSKIDMSEMLSIMERHQDLAILRLPFRPTSDTYSKNWRFFFPWNGEFFECPAEHKLEVGFCGHPSLIRGEFVKNTVVWLSSNSNPEKQFHHGHPQLMEEVLRWRYGVYAKPLSPPTVRDIGREWMVKHGFRKKGNKAFFTVWEQFN